MQRVLTLVGILAVTVVFGRPATVNAADDSRQGSFDCDSQAIMPQLVEATGKAILCVSRRGVRGWMRAAQLVPGHAYTVWLVYFDDPAQCEDPGECGKPSDFTGENPLAVFGRMDSSIAPESGKVFFSGRIGGFSPSSGSQLWFWIFGHGPADREDGRHLARQLLTPEDPTAGAPHLGNNVDGPLGFPAAVVMFDIP